MEIQEKHIEETGKTYGKIRTNEGIAQKQGGNN